MAEEVIVMRVPATAWELLATTLRMDIHSKGFTQDLRDEIKKAFDQVRYVDAQQVISAKNIPGVIEYIHANKAHEIFESGKKGDDRRPLGLFIVDEGDGVYSAIDNSAGSAFTHTFRSLRVAQAWLHQTPLDEDVCAECGEEVECHRVNRVPILDDFDERVMCGYKYPEGKWICQACDDEGGDQ